MVIDYATVVRTPSSATHARLEERRSFQSRARMRRWMPTFHGLAAVMIFLCAVILAVVMVLHQSRWDGTTQHGILLVKQTNQLQQRPLALLVVRGKEKTVALMPLPDTLLLETLKGYGLYKSSSLVGLAELEKLPLKFVEQTIAMQFGIDVEDMVVVRADDAQGNGEYSPAQLQHMFLQTLLLKTDTSLGFADRYKLWRFFGSVRKDQLTVIDMISSNLVTPSETQQSEKLYIPDIIKLDTIVGSIFSDKVIQKEAYAVAVVNTTGESRLATRVARSLSLMGYDVVNITQTPNALDQTRVDVENDQVLSSHTLGVLRSFLDVGKKNVVKSEQNALEYRADIVLFLGNDTADLLRQSATPSRQ